MSAQLLQDDYVMSTVKSIEKRARRGRRSPGPDKKAPFAPVVPRAVRRVKGRATAPLVAANIRTFGVELEPKDRETIRERLGMKLGKFALNIERISVRISDVNGPEGGIDTECRIKVVLSGFPSVVVSERAESVEAAVNRALDDAQRHVRRTLQRRRTKPIKAARVRI